HLPAARRFPARRLGLVPEPLCSAGVRPRRGLLRANARERAAVVGPDDRVGAPGRATGRLLTLDLVPAPVGDAGALALGRVAHLDAGAAQLRSVLRALKHAGSCLVALRLPASLPACAATVRVARRTPLHQRQRDPDREST